MSRHHAGWAERKPMPAHRRQQIHGALQPMAGQGRAPARTTIAALAVATFCALYFAAQLLRPLIERIFA